MFRDRADAGRQLAAKLQHLKDRNPVVLALPRSGVPVGFEIALAVPVAASDTLASLQPEADEVICVETPGGLGAIRLLLPRLPPGKRRRGHHHSYARGAAYKVTRRLGRCLCRGLR
jgi:predicted phosphoribosyltransferase